MTTLNRRNFIGAAAALAGGVALPRGASAQAQQLVVNTYGARWERFWRDTLLPGFQRSANIQATLDVGLGRTWMANLRAAGVNAPPYSILMINEVFANVLRAEGFFDRIDTAKLSNWSKLHPLAQNDGNSVFGMVNPIGLGYRSDMVRTPPRSWKDLWDNREFRGKTGMYQIGNSAGQMFLMLASKLYGSGPMDFDVGFRKIEELKPFPQVDFSGSLSTLLARGEVIVGPLDLPEVVALKRRGLPIEFAAPSEGMFMFEQSFNILKNGPAKDAAYRYLDYLIATETQTNLVNEFFITPVNRDVAIPESLRSQLPIGVNELNQIMTWDWTAFNAQRDAVIDRWNRVMR
ncbi:MAG: extracellular solute-binding protein [Alphaproteobacteria bacterium]|nr:extracellular solute-binding protein [Alphaproteobacteria bacterium]